MSGTASITYTYGYCDVRGSHASGHIDIDATVPEISHPYPLLSTAASGRLTAYRQWVVADGSLWRPAMPRDLTVVVEPSGRDHFSSRVQAQTAASALSRSGDLPDVRLHGTTPMVRDDTVIPGWIFYSSGTARMVYPDLFDESSEPSAVARFIPASLGSERVRQMAEDFGVAWTPEHDVFVPSAIRGLGDLSGASSAIDRARRVSRAASAVEAAVADYLVGPSPDAAQSVADAILEHQRLLDPLEGIGVTAPSAPATLDD